MRIKRSPILLLLGAVIVAIAVVMFIPRTAVQAQGCDPAGVPCPPPPEKKHRKTPTPVPPTKTPIPTSIPPTATEKALLIIGGGAGSSNPNSELPAIQNPGQGSSPFNFPGPLGMIIAVLIIVVCIIGGLFIASRRRKIGNTGESKLLPYMERGGNENATITVPSFGDFDGHLESGTLTVRDIDWGDSHVNEIRESPSAPSSVPGSPTKTPNPSIGDKSGGGTL